MNKKYLNVKLYFWLLFLVSSIIFVSLPQIDLYVASLFYDGKSFTLNGSWIEDILYHSVKPLIIIFALSSIAIFIYNYVKKKNLLGINSKTMLFIILFLTIAPALIVNTTLKENWGRARPAQIIDFGGTKEFTPAFIPSNQGGYSFSSGHAAAAFSLLGFALLAKRRQKFFITTVIIYGVLVSLARMAAGGHFFSDVVTSFFIVYIATHVLYKLVFKEDSI
ncbi:phosphatase PAP2 family protein [Sulfurimonas gotlandica]|jgi:lipid A 4'-phosphatase|uniref:phosphatase PAP2 family protein n=1 Tax=Sulfurimonas gotlandica TaxID=1176482 RepID=UPI000183A4D1|nr:phosphatase PAP2 family protein [Sulfurimonas gotlandica]EDZ63529.1 NADH:ubiquinone oxidoreductase, F subunit [Sulfurimonas gotlandica GD1]